MSARLTRRAFVNGLLGASALALAPRRARAAPPRPHYVVEVLLLGGFDAVLSVDPKDPSRVGAGIDTGYRSHELVKGSRRLFGPFISGLERHDDDLALVHGVRYDTVGHPDGTGMVLSGHQLGYRTPAERFADRMGAVLPGTAPLRCLNLGGDITPGGVLVPGFVTRQLLKQGPSVFDAGGWTDAADRVRAADATAVFGAEPEQLAAWRRVSGLGAPLRQLVAGADRQSEFRDAELGARFQLALGAIRRNLARYIMIGTRDLWLDSHTDNLAVQKAKLAPALADLARFIDLLKNERNEHGSLLSQTTVFVGSEIGRYPKLNGNRGKDHWPENSWILIGKGVRGGVTVGATDERYRGASVDFDSGSVTAGQRRPIMIDAIFATLLAMAGQVPQQHGYAKDEVLRCLLG